MHSRIRHTNWSQQVTDLTLDVEYYPDHVDGVSLEIRAYTNGDVHVSYHETRAGERRQCRWDRHDQPHNARDHFHPLPDAGTATAVDQNYSTDLTRVIEKTALPWVGERVGSLWRSPTGLTRSNLSETFDPTTHLPRFLY